MARTRICPAGGPTASRASSFVVTSELAVPIDGVEELETAFRNRLGSVDAWPGFQGMEVWCDGRAEGRYMLVSWWRTPEDCRGYMHSQEHRESHTRVPTGDHAPRAVAVRRFRVVGG